MREQASAFAQSYLERMNWDTLPLYIGMVVIISWLALLSILLFDLKGVTRGELGAFVPAVKALMYLFALTPFLLPLVEMATKRWLE